MKVSKGHGGVPVGNWHFAKPHACVLCHRTHSIDEAIRLNRRPSKHVRAPWARPVTQEESP